MVFAVRKVMGIVTIPVTIRIVFPLWKNCTYTFAWKNYTFDFHRGSTALAIIGL
jgi:hypothetical protein